MLATIEVRTVVCPILRTNSFVVRRRGSRKCVVIDPGIPATTVPEALRRWNFTPEAVLLTHGHGDHICGVAQMKREWPDCPVLVSREDAHMLTDPAENLSAFCGFPFSVPEADLLIEDGEFGRYVGIDFEIRRTPGHTAGHVSFLIEGPIATSNSDEFWRENVQGAMFAGDMMMAGKLGRSATYGCDEEMMVKSIQESVFTLPDSTLLFFGHGPSSDVLTERLTNTLRMSRRRVLPPKPEVEPSNEPR